MKLVSALALALVLLIVRAASAHQAALSTGEYIIHGDRIDATLVFARASAPESIPIEARADGMPCEVKWRDREPVEGDGVRVRGSIHCPVAPHILALDFGFLATDAHQHLVHVGGDLSADAVATKSDPEVRIGKHAGHLALVWLGVRHILSGWDHLAFVVGLVLVRGRLRSIVGAVTAFTVAHSITLGLAAFDVLRAPPSVVEPMIALSVAYVGIENFFIHSLHGRWRITFPFGLIHGFGFASVLRDLAVPRARIPLTLLSFNLGVEFGQLAVLCVVLPLLFLLHRSHIFAKWGVRAASGAIAVLGVAWLVVRLV